MTSWARGKPAAADVSPSETTAADTTQGEAVESGRQRAFRYVFAATRLSLGRMYDKILVVAHNARLK